MTAQEFSSEFDILYNNISSNQAPGLTEYEKSVFLTKAQDEIIKNYFTNVQGGNKYQQGIEGSQKRFADFSCLISVEELNGINNTSTFDPRGVIFNLGNLKADILFTISENYETDKDKYSEVNEAKGTVRYQVVPITYDEYTRLMSKPSNDPLKRQVWKLMGNSNSGNGTIEIVPHWKDIDKDTKRLWIRYVRKPYPIILEDFHSQGLTINGEHRPWGNAGSYKILQVEELSLSHGTVITKYAIFDSFGSQIGDSYTTMSEAQSALDTLLDSLSLTNECCELSKELHPEILQRGVELAKIFYQGQPADVLSAGQRSE